MKNVKDIKIILGEECFAKNRLLTMDLLIKNDRNRKVTKTQRVKIWKWKDENITKKVKDKIKETAKETECWDEWSQNIMKSPKQICVLSRGSDE